MPPAGARTLALSFAPDRPLRLVSIDGAPAGLALTPHGGEALIWTPAGQPVDVVLEAAPAARLALRYQARIDGWPQGVRPAPAPAPDEMPYGQSETTLATGVLQTAW